MVSSFTFSVSSLGLIVHESFILPSKEEGIMSREKNRKCK
jgi:hypothetical protein